MWLIFWCTQLKVYISHFNDEICFRNSFYKEFILKPELKMLSHGKMVETVIANRPVTGPWLLSDTKRVFFLLRCFYGCTPKRKYFLRSPLETGVYSIHSKSSWDTPTRVHFHIWISNSSVFDITACIQRRSGAISAPYDILLSVVQL